MPISRGSTRPSPLPRPTAPGRRPPRSRARERHALGKASEFSWSTAGALAGRTSQSVSVEYPEGNPPEYMRIIDADLKVMAERVRVRSPDDPETWVEIDRVTRMAFHYTEFLPKRDPSAMQPSLTTYYDLYFQLHPPASD